MVDNANAGGLQGATDKNKKMKIGNAKVQEQQSPGAIIEKIDNSKASEVPGAIIKEKIDNSKASEVPGAIIKAKICRGEH